MLRMLSQLRYIFIWSIFVYALSLYAPVQQGLDTSIGNVFHSKEESPDINAEFIRSIDVCFTKVCYEEGCEKERLNPYVSCA